MKRPVSLGPSPGLTITSWPEWFSAPSSTIDLLVAPVHGFLTPEVKLADIDPNETGGLDKKEAGELLAQDVERIGALQEKLLAENQRALPVVLQGMDPSGKSGTISAVFRAVHPHGFEVTGFGAPS